MSNKLVLIEFNEVNFAFLNEYLKDETYLHRWSNLRALVSLERVRTVSEKDYDLLEPWIQWSSVHSGLTAEEHKIFRLGDVNLSPHAQIFELLEKAGLSVGCISAMNAENRMINPAYFIPDPWTVTKTDGSFTSESVYAALHQAVNDNSSGKLTKKTIASLLWALLMHAKVRNWSMYIKIFFKVIKKRSWNKALFLDLFLSDLHQSLFAKHHPDFTTVFFNGFAHLQHHYLFSSKYYAGSQNNPSWYIKEHEDPFLDALDVYDVIVGQHFEKFRDTEILIATGLQQVPYDKTSFYYRLRNHHDFFDLIGLCDVQVKPRMTRDFLVVCNDDGRARDVQKTLATLTVNGEPLFAEIDNRGETLFVVLTYNKEVLPEDKIISPELKPINMLEHCAFVAIKNGMHDSSGSVYSTRPKSDFQNLDGKHVKNLFHYLISNLQ